MNRSRVSRVLLPALAAGAMLIATPGASAQSSTVIRPPKVSNPSAGKTWLYYITGLGLGAIAVGLTIMPSRRTHQD
ncbi:MAG: hypothetical protein H6812_01935 [Phycisphaeraceae bacterium]|nr:hypothetical protein [Phycisphaerales bacterium]MCA9305152.1 hypothetical protein [Phycisphaerales bacterium]MCB9841997.1 hypothetical protein [Phycisphaeraceae bacterium]